MPNPATMKCLSVRQPWASLLLRDHDRKNVENRVWSSGFRGELLIHAAKGMTRREYWDCVIFCHRIGVAPPPFRDELVRGAIIGSVNVVDWTLERHSPWHVEGQYGIYTNCPTRFGTPLPWRGQLGLFDVPCTEVSHA